MRVIYSDTHNFFNNFWGLERINGHLYGKKRCNWR